MKLFALGHRADDPATAESPGAEATAVSYLARYVNRDAVLARCGPGPNFAPAGQLFYLDRGIKLREVDGWVQLRLRYRSASGMAEGCTAWLPETWTSPCVPPGRER
ncbi:hypothetical protein AB0A60_33765 [Streptomyces sp. NPDC046275]|uniref:hypothetical protein n=1 Tax=Streptomyces sp. NPDC046275 TaxID=3157201 RepID=UPI0033E5E846